MAAPMIFSEISFSCMRRKRINAEAQRTRRNAEKELYFSVRCSMRAWLTLFFSYSAELCVLCVSAFRLLGICGSSPADAGGVAHVGFEGGEDGCFTAEALFLGFFYFLKHAFVILRDDFDKAIYHVVPVRKDLRGAFALGV